MVAVSLMLIAGVCGILWRTDSFADIPGIKALLRIISDRGGGLQPDCSREECLYCLRYALIHESFSDGNRTGTILTIN